jgi:hypothetical protein
MKNSIFVLIFVAVISLSLTQSSIDDCNTYFPLDKGVSWTYQDFDKKGKLTGTSSTLVEEVVHSDSKTEYKIKASSTSVKAKKDDPPTKNTFVYTCENGLLKIDMSSIIPQETQESFKDMEVTIEQNEMLIPSSLTVGQALEDASLKMVVSSNGMTVMTMTVNITNRKIEKMENVITDAGTFNAAVMTYDMHTKMGFMKMDSSIKDWYSSEVGIVKSEAYDKNGKLTSSRLLSDYSK